MPDLKDILGNDILKEHFRTAVHQKKVSHAYILEGEKGSGKKMLASAFAKILECEHLDKEKPVEEACDICSSCIQIEHRNHPDVLWVTHEKAGVISVKEIREQIVNTIDIMPYKGPYKIYIIDEAEKMNLAAQNAILKTIEEPPGYGILLLLTTNRGAFLPTILSRCILLGVKPVKKEKIKTYLVQKYHVSEQMSEFCAELSMGNVGKAIDAALSEDFQEIRNFCISVLQYIHESEPYELIEKVKKLKQWKESINDVLDILLMWFRDVLLLKIQEEETKIIFKEEYSSIKKQSTLLKFEGINQIFYKIEQTRRRIRSNVNYDTSLEVLLIDIRNQFEDGGNND